MSDTMLSLSVDQLAFMLKEARAAERLVQQAAAQRYAEIGAEMLTALVEEHTLTYSPSSNWVGTSLNGAPFTVDGEAYTATVTITHTRETERRKPAFLAAKKSADAQKLTGDERKDFIAAAMKATEPVSLIKD